MTVVHKKPFYGARIVALCCIMLLSACNPAEEVEALRSAGDSRKVWVFVHLNVNHEDGDLSSYYYYAKISSSLYDRIRRNDIARGFLFLDDVRYLGNDDKMYAFKDEDSQGDLIFRIEDIKRMELLKKPPRLFSEQEQSEENSTNEPVGDSKEDVEKIDPAKPT